MSLLRNARNCNRTIRSVTIQTRHTFTVVLTSINGIEQVGTLLGLLDVCVDQERVGLRVDVLNHDLETVEAASLGNLDLTTETLDQVLIDNTIRCSEEGKDARDEVALVIIQAVVPIMKVLGQINFLSSPERCFVLLVHLPDLLSKQVVSTVILKNNDISWRHDA